MTLQSVIGKPWRASEAVTRQTVAALVRLYGHGDVSVVEALFAPDYVDHDPASPACGRGPESIKQFVSVYHHAFPDLKLTAIERLVEGDTVVLRWAGSATHTGALQDIAPTGKAITMRGVTVTRIADGKAVEGWSNWELGDLQRQLGVWPQSIAWRHPPTPGQHSSSATSVRMGGSASEPMVTAQWTSRNRCPRCSGNILLDDEETISMWACLQCGRRYPVVCPS